MTFKKVDEAVATLIEMNDELTKIDAMLDECDRKNGDAPHRSVCRADRIKVLAGYSEIAPRKTPKLSPEVIGKVTEMVGILTKQKMEYVNHLSVENFTSEVTDEMLKVIAKYV